MVRGVEWVGVVTVLESLVGDGYDIGNVHEKRRWRLCNGIGPDYG